MRVEPWTEWQCGECGAWVPRGYSRHVHVKHKQISVQDVIAARRAAEFTGADALSTAEGNTAEMTHYYATGKEPVR